MIRRPMHLDHLLCRQIHNGVGVRAIAVTNLSGELCRTYCRIFDRLNAKIYYTENISPNFIRCGPFRSRCVDGNCIGINVPSNNLINNPIGTMEKVYPASGPDSNALVVAGNDLKDSSGERNETEKFSFRNNLNKYSRGRF
ncbi:hypothetical protein QR98_0055680 [Sarcoptes scabiei]|nr:hypothetical protein QR98_0055680 [Sarcoptes scabiei]